MKQTKDGRQWIATFESILKQEYLWCDIRPCFFDKISKSKKMSAIFGWWLFLFNQLWGFILIFFSLLESHYMWWFLSTGVMLVVHWPQQMHRNSTCQGPKRQQEAHDHDVVWDRPWVSRQNSPLNVFVGILYRFTLAIPSQRSGYPTWPDQFERWLYCFGWLVRTPKPVQRFLLRLASAGLASAANQ